MTDEPLQRGTPPGSLRYFAVLYAPAARAAAARRAVRVRSGDPRHRARVEPRSRPHAPAVVARRSRPAAGRSAEHPGHAGAAAAARDRGQRPVAAARGARRRGHRPGAHHLRLAARTGGVLLPRRAAALQTLAARRWRGAARRLRPRNANSRAGWARPIKRTELLRDLRDRRGGGPPALPLDDARSGGRRSARPARRARCRRHSRTLLEAERDRAAAGAARTAWPAGDRRAARRAAPGPRARRTARASCSSGSTTARSWRAPAPKLPPWTKLWTAWRTAVRHA